MEKPLVSVIMPSYNAEKYIDEAIDSILNQVYENFEFIIVEDCSTDETLSHIMKYDDSRIHVYKNKNNFGIAYSTNLGIKHAKGKYIALMDDDDISLPLRLLRQVEVLEEKKEIDILGGRTIFVNEKDELLYCGDIPRNNPKYIRAMLLFRCLDFMNPTAMIRKKFLLDKNLYYKDNYLGMQDYQFYIESSRLGNISSIEDFILKHRIHKQSESYIRLNRDAISRKKMYEKIRHDSLEGSGFRLDKRDYEIIDYAFQEEQFNCGSMKEWKTIRNIFRKILAQGEKLQIDYLPELRHVCRYMLSVAITKFDMLYENND